MQRLERLRASLDGLSADALLVTDPINVSYLSGFTGDSSYLLVTPDSATLLTDGRYDVQAKEECPSLELAVRAPAETLQPIVGRCLADGGIQSVAFESSHLSVDVFKGLAAQSPNVRWIPAVGEVERLRRIKDAGEIETIRRSVRIAERAFDSVIAKLTPDWNEREVAFELEATLRGLGADGVSFPPIIAAGPAAALPHYRPRRTSLGDHPILLVDWGASFEGYASDLTRTLHLPQASPRFRDAYRAVLECQLVAIERIRPGVTARDVDAAARKSLAQAGLADAFRHGLGHGIGRQIHESPRLSALSDETLLPGMVVTVEPGVYLEGEFGIRIEDDVLVTETGCEVLSSLPKGLDECRLIL